jgi:cell division septation protein DedD
VDSDTIVKAREALRQKMKDLETQPPAEVPAVAPVVAKPAAEAKPVAKPEAKPQPAATPQPVVTPVAEKPPKKPTKVTGTSAFPPIEGPASSVSAEKQARLDELLRKYRADQVTPEEYHQQRAKILAEP